MKVFFLGTGAAEGLPALFCDCEVCAEARRRGGRDLRTRSTIMIDGTVKIDLPPDTLAHVHAYPTLSFARLRHLLFTHSHDDHFAVRELQYLSPNFAPGRIEPLEVYATEALLQRIPGETGHFFEDAPLHFHMVLPFQTFAAGHLLVTPITAHHKSDELCVNYLLNDPAENRTLLYGSDTGWYDDETWNYLAEQKIDTAIFECGKGASESAYDGHLGIAECVAVRRRLLSSGTIGDDTPFYLTHHAHTGRMLHDELVAALAPNGIQIAFDGLEIDV
jgi:phosphoribosyl 1,2-cyclic phosphate phosphodiesterase